MPMQNPPNPGFLCILASLAAPLHRLANGSELEVEPLVFLKAADDLEQVPGLRIAVRAKHAHQALGRPSRSSYRAPVFYPPHTLRGNPVPALYAPLDSLFVGYDRMTEEEGVRCTCPAVALLPFRPL